VKNYIFTPGPVAVPSEILIEMAKPIMHHRTKEFEAIFAEVREGLKYIYDTKQEVFVLAASGTGAMEGAVVNTLSRGDKVLVVNGGKFGERWGEICRAFGLDTQEYPRCGSVKRWRSALWMPIRSPRRQIVSAGTAPISPRFHR